MIQHSVVIGQARPRVGVSNSSLVSRSRRTERYLRRRAIIRAVVRWIGNQRLAQSVRGLLYSTHSQYIPVACIQKKLCAPSILGSTPISTESRLHGRAAYSVRFQRQSKAADKDKIT
jgi:hypothetical protein